MPSVDIYANSDTPQRVYVRPGAKPITVPDGSTVEQVGRGVIQKHAGTVRSPATGQTRKR